MNIWQILLIKKLTKKKSKTITVQWSNNQCSTEWSPAEIGFGNYIIIHNPMIAKPILKTLGFSIFNTDVGCFAYMERYNFHTFLQLAEKLGYAVKQQKLHQIIKYKSIGINI